jgi:hypothetical protein
LALARGRVPSGDAPDVLGYANHDALRIAGRVQDILVKRTELTDAHRVLHDVPERSPGSQLRFNHPQEL